MAFAPTSAVHRQVSKASRRLFVQTLLDSLVWCWSAALLTSVVWFLAQPWLLGTQDEWVRWAVAGGIFIFATGVGFGLAWRRSPSQVTAALELDGRFQLRERITTTLLLAPDTQESPAGQALIADANERVAKLDVRTRFPLRLSWTALVVPGCALLLGATAYLPDPVQATAPAEAAKPKEERKIVLGKDLEEDVKKFKQFAKMFQNPKTEDEKELKRRIDEILKIDPKNKDQERELEAKIQAVKNDLQDRLDNLQAEQQKKKELENQLKKQLGQDGQKQEGPANDIQKALGDGDAAKAAEKMKELADKLKNDKLDEKQRRDLQNQLDELKKQLNDVADQKAQKDELNKRRKELEKEKQDLEQAQKDLEKQKEQGKIDDKELQKKQDELKQKQQALQQKQQALEKNDAQMKENADKLQELKEVAKDLDKAQKCLGDGKCDKAGDNLADAAAKLEKLGGNNEKEMKELKQGLGKLGGGGDPKNIDRPFAEGVKMNSKDEKGKGHLDVDKGLYATGEQAGDKNFSKIKAGDVQGEFNKLGAQDPAQVIEDQRISEDHAPFVKGYIENLGGPKKK
jgi:septal ring factor EnvC (AmiA/AmiB activator)